MKHTWLNTIAFSGNGIVAQCSFAKNGKKAQIISQILRKAKAKSKIRLPNLDSVRPETAHHAAKDSRAESLDRSEGRRVGFG